MPSLGGFFKGLGRGALKFGGLAAAPFTGGASLWPSILSTAGTVADRALAGRAAGRQAEAGIGLDQDQLRLLAERLGLQAPQLRARNAVRGDILANAQPAAFSGSGRDLQMSGGVSPALLSENSRNLGRQMSRDALLSQMKGDAFTPTPLPQSGKLDTLLGLLSGAGTGVDAWNAIRPPKASARPPMALDPAPWAKIRF